MAVAQPSNKLNLFDITSEPNYEQGEEGSIVENIDHNIANAPPPEVLQPWNCTDSGLASPIACGDEEPPVDLGLVVDIGREVIGLGIQAIFGDSEDEDSEVTCTQTYGENGIRTTTCSDGRTKTEICSNTIDAETGEAAIVCTEIAVVEEQEGAEEREEITCTQTENLVEGTRITVCSDGSEQTESCVTAVDENGIETTTCTVIDLFRPARLQASYTEFLSIRRDADDNSPYELSGAYYTQFNENVEMVMFENKLIGNIPDNAYVLTYTIFNDLNLENNYEAFYCMAKYKRSRTYTQLKKVKVQTFYGENLNWAEITSSPY